MRRLKNLNQLTLRQSGARTALGGPLGAWALRARRRSAKAAEIAVDVDAQGCPATIVTAAVLTAAVILAVRLSRWFQ